ncbi:hypothetical protein OAN81_09120 [Paracoccaceae bacterium]|nr:hypothetical protein [Paracoccaceae bacterium]
MLFAEPIKFSPFALYEQANSNIIIDGVSTKYGLGVAGISLQKMLNDKLALAGKLGYGQNNDQKVSFSGANFKGLVSGSYLDLQGRYLIYQNDLFSVFSSAQFINRELDASNLTGTRNGLDLTGKSNTFINSSDIKLGTLIKMSPFTILKLSAGISQWQLNAKATGYYVSSGVTATAKKNINAIGQDPVFEAGLMTNKDNHNFEVIASSRSLRSKANTEIISAQISYLFAF